MLSDYLLDSELVLMDELTKKLLLLANNETEYENFAEKRFKQVKLVVVVFIRHEMESRLEKIFWDQFLRWKSDCI